MGAPPDALNLDFQNISYDGGSKSTAKSTSISLTASTDTIVANTPPAAGGLAAAVLGSASFVRLNVSAGSDVKLVRVYLTNAALTGSGTPTAGYLATAQSKVAPADYIEVTPSGDSTVIDVNLQGLVAGRTVTFTAKAFGDSAGKTLVGQTTLSLPVAAATAASASKG